ncbi:hypothetical protein [Thalassorhabdomicrobium marinisediminis]|uniref:hypothetical protein n=1 Tax=Thalassorhabdomicrobium marinisediminis TaxID=2170577 RepID=UPI0024939126|nr:hypothetical protein [Thalassorhabdomicrobium marinisediminis]
MHVFFKSFRACDDGAVTVDWVVLTAALVGLPILVATFIGQAAADKSTDLGAQIATVTAVEF